MYWLCIVLFFIVLLFFVLSFTHRDPENKKAEVIYNSDGSFTFFNNNLGRRTLSIQISNLAEDVLASSTREMKGKSQIKWTVPVELSLRQEYQLYYNFQRQTPKLLIFTTPAMGIEMNI